MKPRLTAALVFLFATLASAVTAMAQQASFSGLLLKESTPAGLVFDFSVNDIGSFRQPDGTLTITSDATNSHNRQEGEAMLPIFLRTLEIPDHCTPTVTIGDTLWEPLGMQRSQLTSVPPTILKSGEPLHQEKRQGAQPTASLYILGKMRERRMARLEICPFRIRNGEVEICRMMTVRIEYGGHFSKAASTKKDGAKDFSNPFANNSVNPVFLVVAPPQFRDHIQPLLQWKRQEGYLVEELYPDTNRSGPIISLLQQRYNRATPNRPAPLFILLVGDNEQLGQSLARHNISGFSAHRTDLYYAEFTGDYLPDALLGRLSVRDTNQLKAVIAKTVDYERGLLADSAVLHRSLLVAGKEDRSPAPTVTNGQVNYLKEQLMLHDPYHDTLCFYNPSSDSAAPQIRAILQQGVAMTNYSAHCTASGWRHPFLNGNDIDTMSLPATPFLSINNCCRSNEIIGECFGEHLLRKSPGGAIGAIGASNETLWEEDYWWSVGNSDTLSLNPLWDSESPGAFDRLFHTHQEPTWQHSPTQGQIVVAGNWAVTRSGSPYDAFYWEIYSLLGDPSLMPYIGVPATQQLTIEPFSQGDSTAILHGTPHARVAATAGDTLYGSALLDSNGNGILHTRLPLTDTLLFTATGQFLRPLQTTQAAIPHQQPLIVVTGMQLANSHGEPTHHLEWGDTATLALRLLNAGETTAHSALLHSQPLTEAGGTLLEGSLITIHTLTPHNDTTVTLKIINNSDIDSITLLFSTLADSCAWHRTTTLYTLHPDMQIAECHLRLGSREFPTVKPDTNYTLAVKVTNRGNATARNVSLTLLETDTTILLGDIATGLSAEGLFPLRSGHPGDTLCLTLLLTHSTGTLTTHYLFPPDSITTIALPPDIQATPITLHPNPSSGKIWIGGIEQPTAVTVFNSLGQVVERFSADKPTSRDMSHLANGVYTILLIPTSNNNTKPTTLRLVIAR